MRPKHEHAFQVVVPDYNYWKHNVKCQTGSPVNTDSRGYIMAIADGNYERAYWIARMPNTLASICGRICAAQCELACRRRDIDEAISIFDSEGNFNPRYDESDTITLPADTILFSVGQAYDLTFLEKSDLMLR